MTKSKGKEKGTKAVNQEEEKPSKYINPLTDFGFKYLFGTKELLIDFLNGIVEVESGIVNLTYENTERVAHSANERTARFDLHCTTGTGERIIIEMQNNSQDFFKDRTIYYATFPIQEQAPKKKNWDYKLSPVFSVNIVNFLMADEEPNELQQQEKSEVANKYLTFVQLIDRDTHRVFYKKLTFVYLELPQFTKKENELETGREQWVFILKNLPNLNEMPATLRNEVFEQLFKMAEIAKLSAKDRKEYYRSLKSYRNMNNLIAQRDRKILESKQVIATLKQENTTFRKEVKTQRKMIADLQRQLRQNEKRLN